MLRHRSQILGGLAAVLTPCAAPAEVCLPYTDVEEALLCLFCPPLHPATLVFGVSSHSLPNNGSEHIPFAGILVGQSDLYVGVQGSGIFSPLDQGVAECHDRAGVEIAQADDTTDLTPPSIASSASYDAQIIDGRLDLAALAGVSQDEAINAGVTGSAAEVELGFREVFDVVSDGLDMRDLEIDWSLAGSWSQLGCSGGEVHQPPYRELRLKVFSRPPVGATLKVLDVHFNGAPGAEVLEFDRLDTVQVHPNATVFADVWFKVRAFVSQQTLVGDESCFGGDSNADFSGPAEGLSIAFHNPDPSVSIVPRSGIEYSQTVPEPGGAPLAATALAALAAFARVRRSRAPRSRRAMTPRGR